MMACGMVPSIVGMGRLYILYLAEGGFFFLLTVFFFRISLHRLRTFTFGLALVCLGRVYRMHSYI